jgi:hypothetical protein
MLSEGHGGAHKLKRFSERCQPKVIAEMNDYQFKVVKLKGAWP